MNNDAMHAADVATFTERINSLKEAFEIHDKKDIARQAMIESRLSTIERLVWIAVGGVIVLGTMLSIIGGNILRLLSR